MHLTCHTTFSLRYGTLSPQQLVEKAAAWGVKSLALTDNNNTSCAVEFVTRCREQGIKPILGISFWRDRQWLYTGLARNAEGWHHLCKFLSNHSLDDKPLPTVPPRMEDVWIIYPRLCKPIGDFRDNELLGIRPQHVNRLFSHELRNYQHKLVMLAPVVAVTDEDYALHRTLRAIDLNTVHTKLTPRDLAKRGDRLLPPATLQQFYRPYPAIVRTTQRVIDSCTAELETGLQINRQHFTASKEGDYYLLEKLALAGAARRYPPGPRFQKARLRTERELAVIRKQNFCPYFLITYDIVRYACAAGYRHVGRGSGANSIVAYCIGISDVDPLELDLYFERFINPYRVSPPDFDIDFSWDERDDVTDYIFKRYGREHTALLATYSTFQGRAALREVAKVYGLPKEEVDQLVRDPHGRAQEDPKAPHRGRHRPPPGGPAQPPQHPRRRGTHHPKTNLLPHRPAPDAKGLPGGPRRHVPRRGYGPAQIRRAEPAGAGALALRRRPGAPQPRSGCRSRKPRYYQTGPPGARHAQIRPGPGLLLHRVAGHAWPAHQAGL